MFQQIPLGVLLKNEVKHENMVSIMDHYQEYVPTKSTKELYSDPNSDETIDEFHHILFGGDQLTAERARGSKKIRSNAERGVERFEGLQPVVEDWHTRVALLKVSFMCSQTYLTFELLKPL